MEITIELKGLEAVEAKLGRLGAFEAMEAPMTEATALVQAAMEEYPPAIAGSGYRRTMTLGRRWTSRVESLASEVVGVVGNDTVYAPYVQGELQARVHQGRWQTGQAVLEKLRGKIVEFFTREIQRLIASG